VASTAWTCGEEQGGRKSQQRHMDLGKNREYIEDRYVSVLNGAVGLTYGILQFSSLNRGFLCCGQRQR
jgi:hypothetical protein